MDPTDPDPGGRIFMDPTDPYQAHCLLVQKIIEFTHGTRCIHPPGLSSSRFPCPRCGSPLLKGPSVNFTDGKERKPDACKAKDSFE